MTNGCTGKSGHQRVTRALCVVGISCAHLAFTLHIYATSMHVLYTVCQFYSTHVTSGHLVFTSISLLSIWFMFQFYPIHVLYMPIYSPMHLLCPQEAQDVNIRIKWPNDIYYVPAASSSSHSRSGAAAPQQQQQGSQRDASQQAQHCSGGGAHSTHSVTDGVRATDTNGDCSEREGVTASSPSPPTNSPAGQPTNSPTTAPAQALMKIGGCLIHTLWSHSRISVVTGVGLNVSNRQPTTCIEEVVSWAVGGREVTIPRELLLARIITHLDEVFQVCVCARARVRARVRVCVRARAQLTTHFHVVWLGVPVCLSVRSVCGGG